MDNKIIKISIAVVVAAIIAVSCIIGGRYKNNVPISESTITQTKKEKTTKPPKVNYDCKSLSVKLSSICGKEISETLLRNLDETMLSKLDEAANDSEITQQEWHDITGYTLNALDDFYNTKLSRDMGKNGKDSFVLGFAGDINFTETGYVMTHAKNMPNSVLDCIDETFQNEMKSADIMLVNNEFPYTNRGAPTPDKRYTFHANPDYVKYMTELGVDIVSLANNHAYDYGYDSFIDTINTLKKADIPFVGAGMNIYEASKPVTFLINGYKIAYLACSGVESPIKTPVATENSEGIMGSYDSGELMIKMIKEAKKDCDFVFVYPHWGIENTTRLTNAQMVNSKKYIDAGADAVIGGHPHVLQGMEFYKGKPVIYSLGNFWFNTKNQPTMLLKFEISKDSLKTIIVPGTQAYSETHYMQNESQRRDLYDKIISWSPRNAISIDDEGVVTEK